MTNVLLVEDEDDLAFALERRLRREGYDVEVAVTAADAVKRAEGHLFDAVLLDLGLPDGDGLDVLARLSEPDGAPILVLTGRDDAQTAVRALRLGAADYLTKPVETDALLLALRRALEASGLRRALEAARRRDRHGGPELVGTSPAWREVEAALDAAAAAPRTPVLLQGESGTGKELAAFLIHSLGPRGKLPFVTVNAACLSPALLESELFGHEAGAFTDARTTRRGLFELASGGTLFLDEVADLPREIQPRLLRVLEGHPFRRVGGEREVRCDVRLVSASNKSLAAEVAAGRFRDDLYHRLRVVEIELPPLRRRDEDIQPLALHFLARIGAETGRVHVGLTAEAMSCLSRYRWPGNVRELRNVLERALVLCRGTEIGVRDLPAELRSAGVTAAPAAAPESPAPSDQSLEAAVARHVLEVFELSSRNVTRAARALRISRSTLRLHLRRVGSGLVES